MSIISTVQQLLNMSYTNSKHVKTFSIDNEYELNDDAIIKKLNTCSNIENIYIGYRAHHNSQSILKGQNILNNICDNNLLVMEIQIQDVDIRNIEDRIYNLRNLRMLDLKKNSIECVSELLYDIETIQYLYFDCNPKFVMSNSVGKLNNLITLSLIYCDLEKIPETIGNIHGLKNLYLSNNMLTTLPDSIYRLKNLENLVISHNKFKTLKSVYNMVGLRCLIFSNNLIQELPLDFGKSVIPFKIVTYSNKLRMCPEKFFNNKYIDIDLTTFLLLTSLHYSCKVLPINLGNAQSIKKKDLLNLPFNLKRVKLEYFGCVSNSRGPFIKISYGCKILH